MMSHIFPLLSLAIAIAVVFGYVQPTWSGPITNAKAAIAANEAALDASERFTAEQNQLAAARAAIDPTALMRLESFLPDSVDNVGVILDLNALASRAGLQISKIDVATDALQQSAASTGKNNPVSSVDLSITALGSYGALQGFLSGLEGSVRLLDLRDLSVKGSETGVYSYQMKLRLYWLR